MPGFHEDDEADYAMHDDSDEIELLEGQDKSTKPVSTSDQQRPPLSPSNKQGAEASSSTKAKARHLSQTPHSPVKRKVSAPTPEEHVCPICSKTLQIDNQGLNAHIDFCLSRGAIMEAQKEASVSTKAPEPKKAFTGWTKPESFKSGSKPKSSSKGKPVSKKGK